MKDNCSYFKKKKHITVPKKNKLKSSTSKTDIHQKQITGISMSRKNNSHSNIFDQLSNKKKTNKTKSDQGQ